MVATHKRDWHAKVNPKYRLLTEHSEDEATFVSPDGGRITISRQFFDMLEAAIEDKIREHNLRNGGYF